MWATNYCLSKLRGPGRVLLFFEHTNDVFSHESKRNNAAQVKGSNNDGLTWNWLFHDYAAQT